VDHVFESGSASIHFVQDDCEELSQGVVVEVAEMSSELCECFRLHVVLFGGCVVVSLPLVGRVSCF